MVATFLTTAAVSTAVTKGPKVAVAAMTAFREASKYLLAANAGGSLVGYSQIGRVEPLALIDENCRNSPLLPDTMQVLQSQFVGYLLRAVTMHNISISGATIAQRLEPFGTHRNAATALALGMRAATESFEDRLAVEGDDRELPEDVLEIANENNEAYEREQGRLRAQREHQDIMDARADQRNLRSQSIKDAKDIADAAARAASEKAAADKKKIDDVRNSDAGFAIGNGREVELDSAANLAVGRMVNVTMTDNGHSVTVPLAVKLNCFFMSSMPLVHIVTAGGEDVSFSARFKKYWHGGIDFWRDLVMCQDLIDAHKKNLRADKTGIYLQMMQRRQGNNKAAMVSGMPSINSASNIIVMSADTAAAVELRLNGKLKDFKVRQRIFQEGYAMLMAVIDDKWGRLRIYTRDIPDFTEVSERDLKSSAKGTGPDIGDILAAFRAGSSPRL